MTGCGSSEATVSYDASKNRTTYRTQSYTVSQTSASFTSPRSIKLRAVASCQGQNCTPDSAELIFSASGNSEFYLRGTDGIIVADGARISWESRDSGVSLGDARGNKMVSVSGPFATVSISLLELDHIATASSLKGSIGGESINISPSAQAGLQSLLQKIQGEESPDTSPSPPSR